MHCKRPLHALHIGMCLQAWPACRQVGANTLSKRRWLAAVGAAPPLPHAACAAARLACARACELPAVRPSRRWRSLAPKCRKRSLQHPKTQIHSQGLRGLLRAPAPAARALPLPLPFQGPLPTCLAHAMHMRAHRPQAGAATALLQLLQDRGSPAHQQPHVPGHRPSARQLPVPIGGGAVGLRQQG